MGGDVADAPVTRVWRARGGPTWLGVVVPTMIGFCALFALAGAMYTLVWDHRDLGVGPPVVLLLLALSTSWLVWKVLGTVGMVCRTVADDLLCWAPRRRWSVAPGEVIAVRGDAYGLFLVVQTATEKIWLWAAIQDRTELLAAIRRASPDVKIDRYADPRRNAR